MCEYRAEPQSTQIEGKARAKQEKEKLSMCESPVSEVCRARACGTNESRCVCLEGGAQSQNKGFEFLPNCNGMLVLIS